MQRLTCLLITLGSLSAFSAERIYLFESREDPTTPPDPTVCAKAPFRVSAKLGASLWSIETEQKNGRLIKRSEKIGRATACLEVTHAMFPKGLAQSFFVHFQLPQGSYTALGKCTVTSNDAPASFIVLAGCALELKDKPSNVVGGSATSNSLFNPLKRAGYSTGSLWTLRDYLTVPVAHLND